MELYRSVLSPLFLLELAAVALALVYLALAIRQSIWCWPAALGSVLLSLVVFFEARLYMESALQVFYAAMAVYGWQQWRRGGEAKKGVRVGTWPMRAHALAGVVIAATSTACGFALSRYTDAAFPYLDACTSIGAVVATYMVARKVLENWIYWLAIDGVSVLIYGARELYLYAALFVLYLVMIVIGFREWLADYRAREAAP